MKCKKSKYLCNVFMVILLVIFGCLKDLFVCSCMRFSFFLLVLMKFFLFFVNLLYGCVEIVVEV